MKRLGAWVLGTSLLLAPPGIAAQRNRQPHGASTPNEPKLDDDLSQFTRAVVLQATPRQVVHFEQFVRSTTDAHRRAAALAQRSPADLLHAADPLLDALDDVQWDGTRFLRSFSPAQKSGLKPLTKKLAKTNDALNKQTKMLQAARASAKEAQIVSAAEKLDEALTKFEREQRALATEMGIGQEE